MDMRKFSPELLQANGPHC